MKLWGGRFKKGTDKLVNDFNSFAFLGNIENYFASADNFNHPTSELTIEMWVLSDINDTNKTFYSFISNDSKTLYHNISNQSNLTIFGPRSSIETGISILDNTWKCIARTSLRSTGTEKIYVNGNLVFTGNIDPAINFNSSGIILLGQKSEITGSLDPNSSYLGNIAIFKLYNKVLTETEIKSNFNAVKGRFYPYITDK